MLRPQLKDMYQGGHQLDMKKGKKVNPPPMNASPAKQQQEKRRAAAKEAAEKAAMLRQKQAAAAARKRQEAAALKAAQIEESADYDEQYEHEYADQSVQQQQHHEQHEGEYEEADYDDADEAADAAAAAIEAVDAVQGSDYGMDDERDAGSPESDASSAVVTGASPKEKASAPKQLSASKLATEGVSSLAHIQEMCASLSLSEKKKLKGWLGGRIEVEELQDLFDRS